MAKQPAEQVSLVLYGLLKQIDFINEALIQPPHWLRAEQLTAGVDANDISFVALALQNEAWLWTEDKKLTHHLKALGFERVINTADLYGLVSI
ncbi:PIN domain-containing protein [Fibrella forsythiae]|uniref:PIN domain-containing protein n=1 Tax=Fibrella forsythiae TaxID=2817061 RepID=A0ABS3JV32_9BACT|nr:PIN domain-containing protein [Fibrella forsythiae]MBO0953323.1 hypothetical protein [Fibrella forsythiae]